MKIFFIICLSIFILGCGGNDDIVAPIEVNSVVTPASPPVEPIQPQKTPQRQDFLKRATEK